MTLTHPLVALVSPAKCDRRRPTEPPITGNPSASPEVTVPSTLEVVGGKSSRVYLTRVAGTFGFSPHRALHSARDRSGLVSCPQRPWGYTLQSFSLSRSRSPLGASTLLALPLRLPTAILEACAVATSRGVRRTRRNAQVRPADPVPPDDDPPTARPEGRGAPNLHTVPTDWL